MGVSTDAVIFFGYHWEEDECPFDSEEYEGREWVEEVLHRRGFVNPWDCHPEFEGTYNEREAKRQQWTADNRKALDYWYEAKRAVEEEFGVDLSTHCSGDYPMYYLEVKGLGYCARRGYPEEVQLQTEVVDPEWQRKLDKWLEFFEIERPQPSPKWWLVSYWG